MQTVLDNVGNIYSSTETTVTIPADNSREVCSLSYLPPGMYIVKAFTTVNQTGNLRLPNLKLTIYTDPGNGTIRLAQQQNQDTDSRAEHCYTLMSLVQLTWEGYSWFSLHIASTDTAVSVTSYIQAVRIK